MPREADLRHEYEQRFHRVMVFIDRHLDRRITVDELAKEAAFSAFHFHRLFAALQGETIGAYIARRRVETAALRLLAQPRLPIIEVAFEVGFGSPEAFSRAFKQRFGASPRIWLGQNNSKLDHVVPGGVAYDAPVSIPPSSQSIAVELLQLPSVRVHYRRYQGEYGPAVTRFWREQVMPWLGENHWTDRLRVGVCHDDPEFTEPSRCRYDAGVEAQSEDIAGTGAHTTELAGGWFAVTRFWGNAQDVMARWNTLLRDWLPTSGYQLDGRPFMERYRPDYRHDEAAGLFECDILVPVADLKTLTAARHA